ncbi:aminotransferase class IV [Thermoproteota archaeon]
MNQYVWLNNKIVECDTQGLVFCQEGFLYAQGLFETMRTYNGKVFLLDKHIKRLIGSCGLLEIKTPDFELLERSVKETVKHNSLNSGYIRLNVYKTHDGFGVFVFTKQMPFFSKKDFRDGFTATIINDVRQNDTSPLSGVKSLNYYFHRMLSQKAARAGVDEAIILNTKGHVCEGSRSNIFIVKDKKVKTPPLSSGCLRGVTREAVMGIARELNFGLEETNITPQECLASDEVFLTNSLIEIMPVTKIDEEVIGKWVSGNIASAIYDRYHEIIDSEY